MLVVTTNAVRSEWRSARRWLALLRRLPGERLKVAGTRVSCARIRDVLLRFPGMHDAEVFGMEDKARGEVPACRVVLGPGTSVGRLHGWCAAELNPVEVPRSIEPVDHIPRSATGKIMRWL
ncbi:AMP-binding enzyme [Micromonospora sp. WMMD708]|uniref:AMP-binding enzyme n=1 Tax=Micromonospora sp. WMMD708 TaxID=3403464 RepID=UPI003BF5F545